MADAFARIMASSAKVAAYAVIVEALNERARAFYQHVGFQAMADDPRMLYIPLESILPAEASRRG